MATLAEAVTQLETDIAAAKVAHRTARADLFRLMEARMIATVVGDVSASGRQILRDLLAAYPSPLATSSYNTQTLLALHRRDIIKAAGAGQFELTPAAKELVERMEA